jgi:hypothetical protein
MTILKAKDRSWEEDSTFQQSLALNKQSVYRFRYLNTKVMKLTCHLRQRR